VNLPPAELTNALIPLPTLIGCLFFLQIAFSASSYNTLSSDNTHSPPPNLTYKYVLSLLGETALEITSPDSSSSG